jgi:hypothetical protein
MQVTGLALLRCFEHSGFEYLEKDYREVESRPTFAVNRVPVRPLVDVIAEAGVSYIVYVSIDVEGGQITVPKACFLRQGRINHS